MMESCQATCPYCTKEGLSILPMRAAVARTDKGSALDLPAALQQSEWLKDDKGNAITLPANSAKYSGRLLRAGFLYVFNEVRGEWKGYAVSEKGYLYEFMKMSGRDLDDPEKDSRDIVPPPEVPEFSCDLTDDEFKARCVTIPYAKDAGKVWLGFSDTAWTWDVLQAHRKQAVRDQHMQMVDVQAWVAGNTQQADTLPFNQLTQAINEFVEIPSAPRPKLVQTVTESVSVLQSPSEERGPTGENVIELPTITVTAYAEHPSFSYSPHEYFGTSGMTERFAAWGEQETEKGVPPMIAMVADPVGITMEVNHLVLRRGAEWTDHSSRQHKLESASQLESVRMAIMNGAVKEEGEKRYGAEMLKATMLSIISPTATRHLGIHPTTWSEQQVEALKEVPMEEQIKIASERWSKYSKAYDADGMTRFLENYQEQLAAHESRVLQPLDSAYLLWLQSPQLLAAFMHNYDTKMPDNGRDYLLTVNAIISDSTGRSSVRKYLKQKLGEDPSDPANIFLRAMAFNQEQLINDVKTLCEQSSSNPRDPINPLGLAVYDKVKDHFAAFGMSKWLELSGQLSSLFFALGGPLAERATAFIDRGLVWGAAALPDRFAISFMRANLAATSPGQQLAAVEFTGSRQAVARSLATAIADMSGGRGSLYRSGGRQVYDQQAEKVVSGKALIVVDEAEFKRLQMMSGRTPSAQRAATIATHVQVHDFERLYAASVRRFSSLEVKGGVIGALFAAASVVTAYDELAKAEAKANKKLGLGKVKIAYWNISSAIAALTGGLAETAAAVAKQFTWGTKPIPLLGNVAFFKSYSQALSAVARLLGGVGGIIAGVLAIIEGQEEMQTNSRVGISLMALGLVISASSFVVLLTAFGAVVHLGPVAIIVGIIAALLVVVIQLFKDDDIEKWLKRTLYFGKEGVESFDDFTQQTEALKALAEA